MGLLSLKITPQDESRRGIFEEETQMKSIEQTFGGEVRATRRARPEDHGDRDHRKPAAAGKEIGRRREGFGCRFGVIGSETGGGGATGLQYHARASAHVRARTQRAGSFLGKRQRDGLTETPCQTGFGFGCCSGAEIPSGQAASGCLPWKSRAGRRHPARRKPEGDREPRRVLGLLLFHRR